MSGEGADARKWHELGPFTVFDVETTGMSPVKNRIVEIAAVRVGTDGTRTKHHSLVNPRVRIPSGVSAIHGITDEMVAGAPDFSVVGRAFLEFARGSSLVAHNAKFDLGFLQEGLFAHGLPLWEGGVMDSIVLAKRAFPGLPAYNLKFLKDTLGLDDGFGQHHHAMTDVEWTVELLAMSLKTLMRAM
jgi:DNA polymerase III epsilon subunit family exonuclease